MDGPGFFSVVPTKRTRGNRRRLERRNMHIPCKYKEEQLYFEGDSTLEQAAQNSQSLQPYSPEHLTVQTDQGSCSRKGTRLYDIQRTF